MCVCVLLHRGDVVNQGLRSWSTPGVRGSAVRKAKRALPLRSCSAFFMAGPLCFIWNTHIIALQLLLPKIVYCSHVVVLPLWGRAADTSLSHNNSYPFKSSWLKYVNPPFFHACGQVSRCFQHPGWNHKWWDKLGPLQVHLRLDEGEELPSPVPVLLPQRTATRLQSAGGGGCLNPKGMMCHKGQAPSLPAPIPAFCALSLDVCD